MNQLTPKGIGVAELAMRSVGVAETGAYLAYLTSPELIESVATELAGEIRAYNESVSVSTIQPATARDLFGQILSVPGLLLIAVRDLSEPEWQVLDRRRSSLARSAATILIMPLASFATMMRVSPNLASWLGGSVFVHNPHEPTLSKEQAHQRLDALRNWTGLTDAQVLNAAERGELPPDPEYAEWLVLLGRGDLVNG